MYIDTTDHIAILDRLDEEAYIIASEIVSPNSPEFENLQQRIFEELIEEAISDEALPEDF